MSVKGREEREREHSLDTQKGGTGGGCASAAKPGLAHSRFSGRLGAFSPGSLCFEVQRSLWPHLFRTPLWDCPCRDLLHHCLSIS